MYSSHKKYRQQIKESIENGFLQVALNKFTDSYPSSREKAFQGLDKDHLISEIKELKSKATTDHNQLIQTFSKNAEAKGAKVHFAENAQIANKIISEISKKANARSIIKSKSMTSEEIHLNSYLEGEGFDVVETDLGEWIIQLNHERPSHMVMPAIHLSRQQVANIFSKATNKTQPDDIESLVKVARDRLRPKFLEADLGITGANIAIANSGTLALITNEGNARLVSTMPKTHIALVGIEKLVESTADALKIINVLPKNATGQSITSYVSFITGPVEQSENNNRVSHLHIVLLDNGRSHSSKDKDFSQVMNCIRCGACANVCPVYGTIGGHKMGYTYIGPIGLILTYLLQGKDKARHLANNCLNCKACEKVCASGIELPKLINLTQQKVANNGDEKQKGKIIGNIISNRKAFHKLLRGAAKIQAPMKKNNSFLRHLPEILFLKDQNFKSLPTLAAKPLRDIWSSAPPLVAQPKIKVGFFSGCLHDFVYPEQVYNLFDFFKQHKISLDFPMEQSCCGLPLMMQNDIINTKKIAAQNINAFNGGYDYILTMCASCASFLNKSYKEFFENDPVMSDKAAVFSNKVIDFSSFVNNVIGLIQQQKNEKTVAYHSPCHLCRGLDVKAAPREIIQKSGYNYIETPYEENCCGLGGTYSVKFPEISAGIMNKKLDSIKTSKANILVTDCPGCIMQLKGGANKRRDPFEVLHIAELNLQNKND